MSGIDGIRTYLKDHILLFLSDICFHFLHSYVRALLIWSFGFGDISLFNIIYSYKFLLVSS